MDIERDESVEGKCSSTISFKIPIENLQEIAPDDIPRPMPLLLPEHREQLLANGIASAKAGGADLGHPPVVKLFTPDAAATWLLTELNPDWEDLAFGLCDLGFGCPEIGPVLISDIEELRGTLNLPVERDLWFEPDPGKPLSAYAEEAREKGRIQK